MSVFSSVFGLVLRSNLSIPGLVPIHAPAKNFDVDIRLGSSPDLAAESSPAGEELIYVSSYTSETGETALRIWKIADGAFLRMNYFDGSQFWLDPKGKNVWALWPAALSLEDVGTYLLGPVLGFLLRLRGVPCLHASAVAFGDSAVGFAGSEGAGKSTTAAALARRGHAVISDDIVALMERDGSFFALPAYPYLSLWPASVKMLYGAEKNLPSFSANYDKRQLLLAENRLRFQEKPMALGAVFLVGQRVADPAAPFVETLPARENLVSLVASSYATNLLDKEMRAREFEMLGRLVAAVPVWRVRPHQDPAKIEDLCNVIEERCGNLRVRC